MSDLSHTATNIRSLNTDLLAKYLEENEISLEACQILQGAVYTIIINHVFVQVIVSYIAIHACVLTIANKLAIRICKFV